jgi:hypothetical protein
VGDVVVPDSMRATPPALKTLYRLHVLALVCPEQADADSYRRALLCQTIALSRQGSMAKDGPFEYTMNEGAGIRIGLVNWSRTHSISPVFKVSDMKGVRHSRCETKDFASVTPPTVVTAEVLAPQVSS